MVAGKCWCKQAICKLGLAWTVVVLLAGSGAYAAGEQRRDARSLQAGSEEFAATALSPFWRASEIREPLFFIQGNGPERPKCKLLFMPTKVLSVRSATRETKFIAGKDYIVDVNAGTIVAPAGSKIPVKTQEQLYPLMSSALPKIGRQGGDRTRGIFFGEGAVYHNLQVEVKYRFEPGQWKGPVPKYAGEALPKTVAKLRSKQPVKLILCGDSISAGGNASLVIKAPPGCPAYGELTALGLERHYGGKVTFINHAVGGWTSGNGLQQAKEQRIGKESPDLVIVAFGMNDVFQRNAAAYQANVRNIIETVRAYAPDAEFILVASMLGNAEWGMPMEQFPLYRDALAKLCGPGVVLADMTSMWESLLKRKTFYDMTGNGVNHPNDFGHCVYAQVLLALLIDEPK